jgi:hypothetical protein
LNQAKDNFDHDKNSVSEYDSNTQSQLSDFKKGLDEDAKKAKKEHDEWDALPKEAKEAAKRKEQRRE